MYPRRAHRSRNWQPRLTVEVNHPSGGNRSNHSSASRIVTRRVLSPRELESRDANLVGGAVNGGTSQLHQALFFRPIPGLGRAETPIHGLYLGSASAHPGGGVHGAPGMNAARAALAHHRLRRLLPRASR